jgi:hypothetical protein
LDRAIDIAIELTTQSVRGLVTITSVQQGTSARLALVPLDREG